MRSITGIYGDCKEGETIKLLTINTHSIVEEDYENKLNYFVQTVAEHSPDIIAMQEVNQSRTEPLARHLLSFMPCTTKAVRSDNHALRTVRLLREYGLSYEWTWVPIKLGYGKYDEGLAILSRYPIKSTESIYISKSHDYTNWKTRRLLGINTEMGKFYTVHMGWWDDSEEPFYEQWKKVNRYIRGDAWLMGDFNSPDDVRGEGYDEIVKSGWHDVYTAAKQCDEGFTVTKKIDGWDSEKRMRIDYIFSNYKAKVKAARVMFTDKPVSDHSGVMAELG